MTRKDYVMIAKTIKGGINYEQNFNNQEKAESIKALAFALALTFQADNPRFDRHRFLIACGVHNETMKNVLATDGKVAN